MKGFEVYDIKTQDRMLDHYAYTDSGELLKCDSHGKWTKVLEKKEYIVILNNKTGQLEVY